MNQYQRALQLWSLLGLAARNRQILTYELVARLIGVPTPAVGGLLGPVQSYCLAHTLPPLTVLVVSEVSGMPGVGFIAAEHVPQAQADVFRFDWVARGAPSPDNFSEAHNAQA